jgi:hypothetical protein
MIQRGQHFGLALEAGEAPGVGRDRRGQHLDGYLALQVRVGGAVDLAHATHPNLGGDFIGTEASAWSKRHCWAGII